MTDDADASDHHLLQLDLDPAVAVPAQLQLLRSQLPIRDLTVVRDIAALQLMTARQVERLRFREGSPFTQARRSRRTLERLHTLGLVERLDRRIGGARAGSASYLYRLSRQGRRLLGLAGPHGGRHRRSPQPTQRRADHILAVTELAVTLHEAHHAGELELVRFEAEPTSWRPYTGLAGEPHRLRPDAFIIVAIGGWEHLWFVEVDLGTEHLRTLRHKANVYRHYATVGHEQTRWGVMPRVAFLANTADRQDAIARTVHATSGTHELFVVGPLSHATAVLAGGPEDESAPGESQCEAAANSRTEPPGESKCRPA